MVIYSYLLLLLLRLASAASIQPSNDTLPTEASPLELIYTSTGGMTVTAVLAPLTSQIGIGQSLTALNSVNIQGTLQAVSAHSQDIVTSSDIAYISCDPNANTSNISPTDIVTQLIGQVPNVKAILLYSFIAPHCNISGSFPYTTILSMTSVQDAHTLLGIIDMSMTPTNATIMDQASVSASATGSASGSSPTETPPSANSTPAPTTAVAMSILYSITGIITLLFLVIIATGAIRAHRHPERYGPRGGVPGRPRQSRAKGLARAMLETLPIVKFGDGDVKSESPAVELEEGASEHHQHDVAIPPVHAVSGETPVESTGDATVHDTGIGPDENQHTHGEGSQAGSHVADEHLGCSICTEDFEKGEDVRVLPCNHKFHPACIDPWLLNVSGTCPLCRIDLRPAETNTVETQETAEGDTAEGDTALPPPLTETEDADAQAQPARGRLSRRIDAAFMRNASSPERIAALRQLREQQLEAGVATVGADAEREEQSRRARLTGRLRDAFRIRTRPMPEPAAQISEPATGLVRTIGMEESL